MRRLGTDSGRFLNRVMRDVFKAEDDGTPNVDLAASLIIESAEALQRLLRTQNSPHLSPEAGGSSPEHVRQALILVASIAARLATQGDPAYTYDPQE